MSGALARRRQSERAGSPRQRRPRLGELQRANVKRFRDRRQSGPGTEVPCDPRREPRRRRKDRLGRRSGARLGSQKATSASALASAAWFQSITIARPERKHRLSLRTSPWIRAGPASGAVVAASFRAGSADCNQSPDARPSARNGAGSSATAAQSAAWSWTKGAAVGGGDVDRMASKASSTAATRESVHGGGQSAPERSSRARTGRCPSSSNPRTAGRNQPLREA